jgi:hypothetical protein
LCRVRLCECISCMMSSNLITRGLVREFKPWVVQADKWKPLASDSPNILNEFFRDTGLAIAVAKPSENLYLARNGGIGAILNLASHGEMAASKLILGDEQICPRLSRLLNVLPTQVEVNGLRMGEKKGKFLNHFGYRKQVMNFVPETLADHAWIAAALSYSTVIPDTLPDEWMFDPRGGWIAEGTAGVTREGGIFRGSAVHDADGIITTSQESLEVSLGANAHSLTDIMETSSCTPEQFVSHKFYATLVTLVSPQ